MHRKAFDMDDRFGGSADPSVRAAKMENDLSHGPGGFERTKSMTLRTAILSAHAMRLKGKQRIGSHMPSLHPRLRYASVQKSRFRLSCMVLTDEMMYALLSNIDASLGLLTLELTNLTMAFGSSFSLQPLFFAFLSDYRSTLTSVCLANCQVDDDCAVRLAIFLSSANFFPALEVLDVSRNIITDHGALALRNAVLSGRTKLFELDISRNRLTASGMLLFVEAIPALQNLRVLHLRDSELHIPSSLMSQFCFSIERNFVLQKFSVGSEVLDGTVSTAKSGTMSLDIVDDLLRYCWHEPAYNKATDRIRFFLRLNHLGLRDIVHDGKVNMNKLRDGISTFDPSHQTEAWFRILSLKPDLLLLPFMNKMKGLAQLSS